jgi:hypothetical protein
VSPFVLSPEIEDRDEVKVCNWAKHKKTFYSEWYIYYFIFKRITKKIGHELIYLFFFSCSYIKITFFKFAVFNVSINY